jgi:hypothetical protein
MGLRVGWTQRGLRGFRHPRSLRDAESDPAPESAAELLARLNERAERLRHRAEQHQRDRQDQGQSPPPPSSDPSAPPTYQW